MEELDAELERCRPWIEAALDHGGNTHDFEDIVGQVKRGAMQFWPAKDACAVTEIIPFPRKKVFHIFLAGGNAETIADMNDSAEEFARINGCSTISVVGRMGWKKILGGKGYSAPATVLFKEIKQ